LSFVCGSWQSQGEEDDGSWSVPLMMNVMMVQDALWATPIKQPTMCSRPSWQGYKPDYWMGSLDEQLLEGGDYLEAQILSNPISHEGNDEDGRRIIYRWVSVSYNYGLNMLRFSISMVPGHSFAIQWVPCFPSSNCIHYYYIWLSLILKEMLGLNSLEHDSLSFIQHHCINEVVFLIPKRCIYS